MPLPNTRVIPHGWSQHHRPTAEGQLTAECEIISYPSGGEPLVFDETLGYSTPAAPNILYRGPCRVQRLQPALSATELAIADREVIIREYMVVVPHDAVAVPGAAVNDLVRITANPDDPTLIGGLLRIRDIRQGSLIWQRDLTCEDVSSTTR